MQSLVPFLMFCGDQYGKAEEAMTLYCSVFPGGGVRTIAHNEDGTVLHAEFELGPGQRVKAIDSGAAHQFTFTPAVSLWVDCASADELRTAADALAEGGQFLMPVGDYGFSPMFCWVADRFGVTWQLNLAGGAGSAARPVG